MRSSLVKVTEVRYDFTVRYILQKAGISMPDDPPESDDPPEPVVLVT
jgi:hypothetical protein